MSRNARRIAQQYARDVVSASLEVSAAWQERPFAIGDAGGEAVYDLRRQLMDAAVRTELVQDFLARRSEVVLATPSMMH
jgi:hypothetical protein